MKKNDLVNYVKTRNEKLKLKKVGSLQIIFKDHFSNDIDYVSVIKRVNQLLPNHIIQLVDALYVGDFDYFKQRDINAMYLDGAIYVSNDQDNEGDLLDDIIHEYSHACEAAYGEMIYGDGDIKNDFLSKRQTLKRFLRHENRWSDIEDYDFTEIDYDEDLDMFLKDGVGYERLNNLINGLFLNPYSTVSLREYFARGFEEYYLGDRLYLKKICPYIYNKLYLLDDLENNYEI
tara:strand:- start:14718 stop:15413 length:696 start_codon:yes stop_codon:yes gene_type:complete